MSPHHDHPHNHTHDHSHGHHSHAPASFHSAFAWGIGLNSLFIIIELAAGYYAGSLALIADAAHNLGDVMGLIVAWFGYYMSRKKPTTRFPSGFGRMSIYTTILNGVFLVISAIWIMIESVHRLGTPDAPMVGIVILVAAIGVAVNLGTAVLLFRGGQHDINIKGAILHMLGDAGISLAVALSALALHYTGWMWIDPVLSLGVSVFIIWSCWPLIVEGSYLALDGTPKAIRTDEVLGFLTSHAGVIQVHDLRIWALSTTDTALAAHLVILPGNEALLPAMHAALKQRFGFASITLQTEITPMECQDSQNAAI